MLLYEETSCILTALCVGEDLVNTLQILPWTGISCYMYTHHATCTCIYTCTSLCVIKLKKSSFKIFLNSSWFPFLVAYYNFIWFTYFILHNFCTCTCTTYIKFRVGYKIWQISQKWEENHINYLIFGHNLLNMQFANLKTQWNIQHAYSMLWQYCSWKLITTTYILISQTHTLSTCTCILQFLVIMYI